MWHSINCGRTRRAKKEDGLHAVVKTVLSRFPQPYLFFSAAVSGRLRPMELPERTCADFSIWEDTLICCHLHGQRSLKPHASIRQHTEVVCHALIRAAHCPMVSEGDRVTLFRLSDTVFLSWLDCWSTTPQCGDGNRMRFVKCYVSPQDPELWCSLSQQGAEHAQGLDLACELLQGFQENLPKQADGRDLRESSWIEKAIQCLASTAHLLRNRQEGENSGQEILSGETI